MAGRFTQAAVDALFAAMDSVVLGVNFQLGEIETRQSLTPSSIPRVDFFLKHRAPMDNRRVMQIYWERFSWLPGQINRFAAVVCAIDVVFKGDARFDNNEEILSFYTTAMIETILADPVLGGDASAAFIIGGDMAVGRGGDDSETRNVVGMEVEVHIHSPE